MPTAPRDAPGPGHAPGPGPHETAADPSPPAEQLYFTRAEKMRIQSRLLTGSAVFQVVALALVIAVNVGGVHEVDGHVFAEDAYIFTWSKWYVVETPTSTLALLYTFHFYLNALCVRHASGTNCLYQKTGNLFDSTMLLDRVQNHFNQTYGSTQLYFHKTSVDESSPGYTKSFTLLPLVLLILGSVAASAAWTLLLFGGCLSPRRQRHASVCTVVVLLAAGVLHIAASAAMSLIVPDVHREIDPSFKWDGPNEVDSGWSFFAALWSAAVSQCLVGIIQWVCVAVRTSVDRDLEPIFPPSYQGNDDEDAGLPIYSRHDPMGRPPSIGELPPQPAEESFEMSTLARNHSPSSGSSSGVDVAVQTRRSDNASTAQLPGYHQ